MGLFLNKKDNPDIKSGYRAGFNFFQLIVSGFFLLWLIGGILVPGCEMYKRSYFAGQKPVQVTSDKLVNNSATTETLPVDQKESLDKTP